mmetsp:Transcript_55157/g.129134  ORF Transcript_55157/g.129134 Transcript_55157/m.129134 type:complete len:521 (+) Transcript_55157:100-1662(+)
MGDVHLEFESSGIALAHNDSFSSIGIPEQTPESMWFPTDIFRVFYCLAVAATICMHHNKHAEFVEWFLKADIPQAKLRGLGYSACRPYGVLRPLALTLAQFNACACALIACLVLACFDALAPRFFLWSAFGLYFCYFTQLFCESKAGGHSTVMIPTVLFTLAVAGPNRGSTWPLEVLKFTLAVCYCASGLCKLGGSIYFKRFWGSGATLQCYLFEAMWSRPGKHPLTKAAQRFLLCSPWLCGALGVGSLIFEAGFPAILLMPRWASILLGLVGSVAFHGGIELLMGLDFLSYWCPVLPVFAAQDIGMIFGKGSISAGSEILASLSQPTSSLETLVAEFANEPLAMSIVGLYLLAHMMVSFTFRDILGEEKLPLSCCPMFFFPRNLFSYTPKLFCMAGANFRKGGVIDCSWMYNPAFVSPFELTVKEMKEVSYPILTFGTLTPMPDCLAFRVKPEYRNLPFVIFTNTEVPADLKALLEEVMKEITTDDGDAWRHEKLERVANLQEECRRRFNESCSRAKAD